MSARSFTALFAPLLIFIATPAAAEGGWFTDSESKCSVWHADPLPGQKVRWNGKCVDGRAEGGGVAEWYVAQRPPDRCECTFVAGKAHGLGIYRWADGAIYAGEFKQGEMEGKGFLRYPDNETFEGQFKNGLPNGFGVLMLPDNTRIMGKFKDGVLIKP
jgi:hypothetical protein